MPTYEYACKGCGHRFEEFQSMTADPLQKCPACSKRRLERLIGAGAGVIFKGSGFYQTDYKNGGGQRGGGDTGSDKGDRKGAGKTGDQGGGKAGGCTPACGTDRAPSGCAAKKSDG